MECRSRHPSSPHLKASSHPLRTSVNMHQHSHHHEHEHHHHHHDHEPLLKRVPRKWLGVVAALVFCYLTFYSVRETEFALVTQFGQPLYAVSDAGLHMKWCFQSVTSFDRRLNLYNPRPSEFLTRDKKNLLI